MSVEATVYVAQALVLIIVDVLIIVLEYLNAFYEVKACQWLLTFSQWRHVSHVFLLF